MKNDNLFTLENFEEVLNQIPLEKIDWEEIDAEEVQEGDIIIGLANDFLVKIIFFISRTSTEIEEMSKKIRSMVFHDKVLSGISGEDQIVKQYFIKCTVLDKLSKIYKCLLEKEVRDRLPNDDFEYIEVAIKKGGFISLIASEDGYDFIVEQIMDGDCFDSEDPSF